MNRQEFRSAVFARDKGTCVVCYEPGQDAHHIMERRLFPDGGYTLDNGVTVCGFCHLRAESTDLSCQRLRDLAGITTIVLPPHLYPDSEYDKWGNVMLPNGNRLKGELYHDPSVQKVLAPVEHLFLDRVKYPRTWHLPWSPGVTVDDRVLDRDLVDKWTYDVVITEKMDGENTTMYHDGLHARSIDYMGHPSRSYVRQLHASICGEIPEGWRICGENLWAEHSIAYHDLSSYFQVFSIWNGSICLSWQDTIEWCELLGLQTVKVLWQGEWQDLKEGGYPALHTNVMMHAGHGAKNHEVEGYVVRPAESFELYEFTAHVGKFVRQNHVTTHGHWMHKQVIQNRLKP